MAGHSRVCVVRVVVFCCCGLAVLLLVMGRLVPDSGAQVQDSAASKLVDLGKIFNGAQSCSAAKCHGKAGDDDPPAEIGHEYTIWDAKDAHRAAYETLTKSESKDMCGKLGIADAKTSDRCLSCHALNVPEPLRGKQFNIREGNTCDQCHGPSQDWLEPHAEDGWTQKQREAAGSHAALLQKWGLYDTKPTLWRAELCASCHLQIDADMVAAGHPQPIFEMGEFTFRQPKHWVESEGYFQTKVWLSGQVVSLRESMKQLAARASSKQDADAIKAAYQQAMAHLSVLKPAASMIGMDGSALESSATALTGAIANPSANADAIVAAADAVATLATGVQAAVENFDPESAPNKKSVVQILTAIAQQDLSKDLGQFGMAQQAMSLSTLYNAYAKGQNVPESDRNAVNDLIFEMLPDEGGEIDPGKFTQALPTLREKLPKS